MATAGYSLSIQAIDGVTGVIDKINSNLNKFNTKAAANIGKFQKGFQSAMAPTARLNTSLDELSKNVGLDKLRTGFEKAGESAKTAAAKVASFTPVATALSAVAGAASIAGISAMINHWTEFGRTLSQSAAALGTTGQKLQEFQIVGGQFGISAETMTAGVKGLGDTMQNALMGRAPAAARLLRQLGVDFESSAYKAKTGADKMAEVRDRLSEIHDPLQRAAIATELFGGAAQSMMPYLSASKEQITEMTAIAKKYALTLDETKGAEQFARQQYLLGQSVSHFTSVLSSKLAPLLEPIIKGVTDFIDSWATPENINLIIKKVESFIGGIKTLGGWIDKSVKYLGGWHQMLSMIAAVGITAWLEPVIAMVAKFTTVLLRLGIAMLANPIGLTVAALAALGYAGYKLYQNWDEVKKWLGELWDSMKEKWNSSIAYLKDKLKPLSDWAESMIKAWEPVGTFFRDMWGKIGEYFEAGWAKIKPIVDKIRDAFWWVTNGPGGKGPTAAADGTVNSNTLGSPATPGAPAGTPQQSFMQRLAAGAFHVSGAAPPTTNYDTGPGTQGGAGPRGIRNNNPLNLTHVNGQIGLDPANPSDGRFGRYQDMEGGVAQGLRQLQLYQKRDGLTTVGAMIGKWAPPNENNTAEYVRTVAGRMGISPSQPFDINDAGLANKMIAAMARVENGREIDPGAVQRGVGRVLGGSFPPASGATPAAPATPATPGAPIAAPVASPNSFIAPKPGAAANGNVNVDINLRGAPAGTTATAVPTGTGISVSPPRVQAMTGGL